MPGRWRKERQAEKELTAEIAENAEEGREENTVLFGKGSARREGRRSFEDRRMKRSVVLGVGIAIALLLAQPSVGQGQAAGVPAAELAAAGETRAGATWEVRSPSGQLVLTFGLGGGGRPWYTVAFKGRAGHCAVGIGARVSWPAT